VTHRVTTCPPFFIVARMFTEDRKDPEFLTAGDVAKALHKSKDTILYYERIGRLSAIRTVGGIRLFDRGQVERLAERIAKK
jgi:MerR family regulatory protein